ncbi:MAG TPA: hypothetical protein ENF42_02705, partial [Candidatus Bathyarchaeota archaeon]|nr:hypothetical protein [Candidatus Bathyarchaeota archaeon]
MGIWNLKFLDRDEIEKIHETSLEILSKVGIKVDHNEIHEEIKKNGAEETKDHRLLLSDELVEEAIKKSTKKYSIYARNSKYNLKIGSGNLRFLSSGGQMWIVDPIRKERRKPTIKDLREAIIIGDALENINIVGSMVIPQEIPVSGRSVYIYSELIKNSSKVVFSWIEDPREAPYVLR